ncbi:metalloregulator ArsR/SmtB family transcription factor [Qipengyuania sp. JC766]|uniref:ArsR/SmtB family transcription factor n=1 Tax=Qipengyuania sp. JC766 TaxID=3232139 RepID=UPI003457839E
MTDAEIVDALKALAHPVRLRIMQALAGTELNVGEIDDAAEIGQPTLSQQLAVLRNAGLVQTRKDAKLVYYRIDESRMATVTGAMERLAEITSSAPRPTRKSAPGVANFARLG